VLRPTLNQASALPEGPLLSRLAPAVMGEAVKAK
jgi:hypothetical protein